MPLFNNKKQNQNIPPQPKTLLLHKFISYLEKWQFMAGFIKSTPKLVDQGSSQTTQLIKFNLSIQISRTYEPNSITQ